MRLLVLVVALAVVCAVSAQLKEEESDALVPAVEQQETDGALVERSGRVLTSPNNKRKDKKKSTKGSFGKKGKTKQTNTKGFGKKGKSKVPSWKKQYKDKKSGRFAGPWVNQKKKNGRFAPGWQGKDTYKSQGHKKNGQWGDLYAMPGKVKGRQDQGQQQSIALLQVKQRVRAFPKKKGKSKKPTKGFGKKDKKKAKPSGDVKGFGKDKKKAKPYRNPVNGQYAKQWVNQKKKNGRFAPGWQGKDSWKNQKRKKNGQWDNLYVNYKKMPPAKKEDKKNQQQQQQYALLQVKRRVRVSPAKGGKDKKKPKPYRNPVNGQYAKQWVNQKKDKHGKFVKGWKGKDSWKNQPRDKNGRWKKTSTPNWQLQKKDKNGRFQKGWKGKASYKNLKRNEKGQWLPYDASSAGTSAGAAGVGGGDQQQQGNQQPGYTQITHKKYPGDVKQKTYSVLLAERTVKRRVRVSRK